MSFLSKLEIVPDVLASAPESVANAAVSMGDITFSGGCAFRLKARQSDEKPTVTWEGAQADKYYSLIMTDPDAPSRAEPL